MTSLTATPANASSDEMITMSKADLVNLLKEVSSKPTRKGKQPLKQAAESSSKEFLGPRLTILHVNRHFNDILADLKEESIPVSQYYWRPGFDNIILTIDYEHANPDELGTLRTIMEFSLNKKDIKFNSKDPKFFYKPRIMLGEEDLAHEFLENYKTTVSEPARVSKQVSKPTRVSKQVSKPTRVSKQASNPPRVSKQVNHPTMSKQASEQVLQTTFRSDKFAVFRSMKEPDQARLHEVFGDVKVILKTSRKGKTFYVIDPNGESVSHWAALYKKCFAEKCIMVGTVKIFIPPEEAGKAKALMENEPEDDSEEELKEQMTEAQKEAKKAKLQEELNALLTDPSERWANEEDILKVQKELEALS